MSKTKYDAELFPKMVESFALDGLIEKDIARKLGVSTATFETYKIKYPEFLEALKKGKAPVDFEVEKALLKRCLGFSMDEVTKELYDGQMIETKRVTKYYPPDVGAIQTWLSNRKNDKWKRNPDLKSEGEEERADVEIK